MPFIDFTTLQRSLGRLTNVRNAVAVKVPLGLSLFEEDGHLENGHSHEQAPPLHHRAGDRFDGDAKGKMRKSVVGHDDSTGPTAISKAKSWQDDKFLFPFLSSRIHALHPRYGVAQRMRCDAKSDEDLEHSNPPS